MLKRNRKWTTAIVAGALLLTLVGTMSGSSSAAPLTGGTYTYVINGEESMFPYDPIKLKDGMLLPIEVLQRFGITVGGALTQSITLKKAEVQVKVTLGSTTVELNGQPVRVDTAPLRLSGRLFMPSDLLKHFGVDFSQDGNYVVLRDYTEEMTQFKHPASDWSSKLIGRNFTGYVKAEQVNLYADFTLLNQDIIAWPNLQVSYGTRARLHSLMKTNTLVLVKLSNSSFKAAAVAVTGFILVDSERRQYDLVTTLDTGEGPITAKIAPAADRTGVLVFPKVSPTAGNLMLYFDGNGGTIGVFTNSQQ